MGSTVGTILGVAVGWHCQSLRVCVVIAGGDGLQKVAVAKDVWAGKVHRRSHHGGLG